MKLIPLTRGLYAKVDDKHYKYLSQFKWHAKKSARGVYYAKRLKNVYMHRIIMNAQKGQMIDHKNRDGLDNQEENLRFCTYSQNNINKKPSGTSKYLGVYLQVAKASYRNKEGRVNNYVCTGWIATIKAEGKHRYLGRFACEIEAAKAYDKAAIKYHREFANLNFKSQ